MVDKALCAMFEYFGTNRLLINHSLKVYGYARTIGLREQLPPEKLEVLECAAVLHDIGVLECLRVFGTSKAEYREAMGAKVAEELLTSLQIPQEFVERVVFLIAHQYSSRTEGGVTLQVLFEAITIATMDEGKFGGHDAKPERIRDQMFRTRSGRELVGAVFGIPPKLPTPPGPY